MTDSRPEPKVEKRPFTARALQFYRSRKQTFFPKVRLGYERTKHVFRLPGCYRKVRAFKDCKKSGIALAFDLLTLFFSYKTFPDHYGLCRLWEVDRNEWKYYYGSNYHPRQHSRLKATVQPFDYRVLFNDKYLCVLLCSAMGIRTPQTYGVINPNEDYRAQIRRWLQSHDLGPLIIKPLFGERGRGIVLAERSNDTVVIRKAEAIIPLQDYCLKEQAIVQEVVSQDSRMAAFSPHSVTTHRVLTMITPQDQVLIINAYLRTGVGNAYVDNFSAGGVSPGLDLQTGNMKTYAYDKDWHRYVKHPTTGIVFEGYQIPDWSRLLSAAMSIQRSFSFYRLLGQDLAIDQSGEPVVIELNGAPDLISLEQKVGPLLKSEPVLRAFGEYDLLVNKHQRRLYAGLVTR